METQELRFLGALLLALAAPVAADAQATPANVVADPALRTRADELVTILAKQGDPADFFAPSLLRIVRYDQMVPLFDQLIATMGRPVRIADLTAVTPRAARLTVVYERGTAAVQLSVEAVAPYRVDGFRVTGTTLADDTLGKVEADAAALPGIAVYGVYALEPMGPRAIAERGGETPAPLGSAFKLWVLDEAARQVAAGRRRWSDAIALGPHSLPSGITQSWPAATPMTLQSLATLMVSISDNTATDTLIRALGPTAVDAAAAAAGGETPVLTTREAFALKADATLRAGWQAARSPAAKRAFLTAHAGAIATRPLDVGMFAAAPLAIDSVEWFASPRAMARLLDRLGKASPTVRQILGVNPGVDPTTAAAFAYIGFKGGSEPGVIALNFLVETKAGKRYAVTGSWHRPDGPVDDITFLSLMTRIMRLAAR